MLLLLPAAGCHSPPGAGGDEVHIPPYETIAAIQNQRVDRLQGVAASGVIELRWADEDGRHFEQGDVEVWFVPPRRTALYIRKFGERLMWLGSDETRTWVFDFRNKPTSLVVVADGDAARSTAAVPFEPSVLLALAGLTRVPETSEARHPVGWSDEHDAYVIEGPSEGVRLRLYLDRRTMLPVMAEALDSEGQAVLTGTMKRSRYQRVQVNGSGLGGPEFPTLVDLKAREDRLSIKLSFPDPPKEGIRAELFDLDWLTDRFRPEQVEGAEPLAAGPAAPMEHRVTPSY